MGRLSATVDANRLGFSRAEGEEMRMATKLEGAARDEALARLSGSGWVQVSVGSSLAIQMPMSPT